MSDVKCQTPLLFRPAVKFHVSSRGFRQHEHKTEHVHELKHCVVKKIVHIAD